MPIASISDIDLGYVVSLMGVAVSVCAVFVVPGIIFAISLLRRVDNIIVRLEALETRSQAHGDLWRTVMDVEHKCQTIEKDISTLWKRYDSLKKRIEGNQ